MKQTACKLCGKTFVCDNGRWFTTCTCAASGASSTGLSRGRMMDMSKVTPAPWRIDECSDNATTAITGPTLEDTESSKGRVMQYPGDEVARAAYDVMQRRGWGVRKIGESWTPVENDAAGRMFWQMPWIMRQISCEVRGWDNPFTALVAADAWMKANVD